MSTKGLGLILMISLGIHIMVMSAVDIVSYDGPGRNRPYTRIDFLGPILSKTSFDLMLESPADRERRPPGLGATARVENMLKVKAPNKASLAQDLTDAKETNLDSSVAGSLIAGTVSPEARIENMAANQAASGTAATERAKRSAASKPDAPTFVRGQYGDKDTFRIKVRVLVNSDGSVIKAEPLTTTGYPQLDIAATEYAKRWTYEPSRSAPGSGEWIEEEITLKAGE